MKKMVLAILMVSMTFSLAYSYAEDEKPGKAAAKEIAERVKTQKTSSSDQDLLVNEIADYAKKAGDTHPDDPDAVKKAVKEKLDEIKERKSMGQGKNRKPGGKNAKEIEDWINDLAKEMKTEGVIMIPGLKESGMLAKATGTGRTTGHIADLALENNTERSIHADIGPFFIPVTGKYQPYLVPSSTIVTVPPHSGLSVSLDGLCADIHMPPVPAGMPMVPVHEWISPRPVREGWEPEESAGWVSNPGSVITVPGTDESLLYSIDLSKHPDEAAPLLFQMATRITEAYDSLKNEGKIDTPFSQNPDKERESVIQQTFWISAAALTGVAYKLDDFAKKTEEQFEKSTGKNVRNLPEEEKKQLENGISGFWETFQAVGAEAKVLSSGSLKNNPD